MKIELENNKVFFENEGLKKEVHPFWLRERINGESFVDKATRQRLFDPTELEKNIQINSLKLSSKYLEITFNDGIHTKLAIQGKSRNTQEQTIGNKQGSRKITNKTGES